MTMRTPPYETPFMYVPDQERGRFQDDWQSTPQVSTPSITNCLATFVVSLVFWGLLITPLVVLWG